MCVRMCVCVCCLQDLFFEKHGCKLGFMSAFIKAAAYALTEVPAVNAGKAVRARARACVCVCVCACVGMC